MFKFASLFRLYFQFQFTSQLPYAERIGRPYAITVDIHNSTLLKKAIQEAILLNPSPYVPKELSTEGMLLRLALLVEKQDFCNPDKTDSWPPVNQMQVCSFSELFIKSLVNYYFVSVVIAH